jgi:hypothetical protein
MIWSFHLKHNKHNNKKENTYENRYNYRSQSARTDLRRVRLEHVSALHPNAATGGRSRA